MRRALTLLWLAMVLGTGPAWSDESGQARAEAAGAALIGTPAPGLKLNTIDGKTVDLAEYYGHKAVYLKFWATWCVPCLQQMPHFEHAYENAGPDLVVIAVNTNFNETPERVAAYRRQHGLRMPVVMDDGKLAAALNLRVTPQHVLIARDGRIAYVGHLADPNLDEALAAVQRPDSRAPKQQAAMVLRAVPQVVQTLGGETFTLKDPRHARSTVLLFVSPWCESYLQESRPEYSEQCREARLETQRLAAAGGARWIAIASGLWANDEDLRAYQQKNAVGMPLTLDVAGDLFRAYHVNRVPTAVVIGADGQERQRRSGDLKDLAPLLASASAPAQGR